MNGMLIITICAVPFVLVAARWFVVGRKGEHEPNINPKPSVPSISDETDPGADPKLPSEWYEEDP